MSIAAAVEAVRRAEQKVADAQRATAAARDALDAELARIGWTRVAGARPRRRHATLSAPSRPRRCVSTSRHGASSCNANSPNTFGGRRDDDLRGGHGATGRRSPYTALRLAG